MSLPGRCMGCGASVAWSIGHWRAPNRVGRWNPHHCPPDRAVCGAYMPYARERCARRPGHGTEHRTRYALDNARRAGII